MGETWSTWTNNCSKLGYSKSEWDFQKIANTHKDELKNFIEKHYTKERAVKKRKSEDNVK